jgi:hypothetical protein
MACFKVLSLNFPGRTEEKNDYMSFNIGTCRREVPAYWVARYAYKKINSLLKASSVGEFFSRAVEEVRSELIRVRRSLGWVLGEVLSGCCTSLCLFTLASVICK